MRSGKSMKNKRNRIPLLLVAVLAGHWAMLGQTPATRPAAAPTRVIGEVTAVDVDSRLMTVKSDTGATVTLVFEEGGSYLRVPPGEKSLEKATEITLGEVGRGDRVYARGQLLPDGKTLPTRQLIVMSRAAIEQKHDREREEWRLRGLVGVVSEVKAGSKEIILQSRGREVQRLVTVRPAQGAVFRRYAPDSVKFSDAKSSSFAELKVGDQLRALGERSADGASYKAEQVVFGSFQTLGGTVTAVNADTGEVKITTFPDRRTLTVVLNKDSTLRRFPAEFAALMAQRMLGGGPGAGPPAGGPAAPGAGPGRPPGAPPAGAPGAPPAGAMPPVQAGQRPPGFGAGGEGRPRGFGGDARDILDRLPPLALSELKPGDAVMLVSTIGKDPSRVTAVAFVSGVDAFLRAAPAQGRMAQGPMPGVSLGLPGGALDMGIGLP